MEPKIVERESFTVVGVQDRFTKDNEDFDTIWMKRFMSYHDKISPNSIDRAYYGVWFETKEEGILDYLAGMAVKNVSDMPNELVVREVPAARYAVFECKVKNIGETWDYIFEEWLPSSKYKQNNTAAGFEYYPPEIKDQESPVFVYFPVLVR